uniref:Capsid protein n=1 Tax=Alphatorquevirus homin13 TaxID=3048415 RepID=A0AAU8H5K1_9VIRU
MAWWGWRRRWWRPRWRRRRRWTRRRRRVPTRRPRRPVRRYRKRRRVRRKRWGRRWTRRGRLRLRRRRRRRKKIILTQWNPQTTRKCYIRGLMPLIWAGMGSGGKNYAVRSDDYSTAGFGGSFGTETFSLRVLFDQYQRGFNRWSHTNKDLDLALYYGCRFRFYRHDNVDFIVSFTKNPPMKTNQYTAPLTHPGMLMRAKYKVLIPSRKTRPRGRKYISVSIKPPNLFQHKWYTQSDLCSVSLVQLNLTAADMQHPFGSPLTDTPCISFQVLGDLYNECLNIDLPKLLTFDKRGPTYEQSSFSNKEHLDKLLKQLFLNGQYWQTFITGPFIKDQMEAGTYDTYVNQLQRTTTFIKPTQTHNYKPEDAAKFVSSADSNYLFVTYHPENIPEKIKEIRDNYFNLETGKNDVYGDNKAQYRSSTHLLEYHLGIYSPIFLSPARSNTQMWTAYRDIVYNPLLDKGEGNRIWFQYHTKKDNRYTIGNCHWMIENLPLWSLLHGYREYLESQIKYGDILLEGKVLITSPYTMPPLYDPTDPTKGWVPYNDTFGRGKWVDGGGYVPLIERGRWYVMMRYQLDVFHDIVTCGPFAYRDDEKNAQLVAGYTFRFKWGGTAIHSQVIRNPCKDEQLSPGPRRRPRDVQVVDPQSIGPPWVFHEWDQRRGQFTDSALRRMLLQPIPRSPFAPGPKRPLLFLSPEYHGLAQESDSGSLAKRPRIWQEEEIQSQTGSEQSEAEAETTRQLLERKLREQQLLQLQLQRLTVSLAKTQAGLHINPLLLSSPPLIR